ncbi:MAG TPA: shikimate dehydrogenase, partial [Gallionella sp.]|nr:shikimate dehydrogenase [Gallionella sp.]
MTDKYAVIGNPIAHSKSPQIHKMFAEQFKGKPAGDISYEKIEAPLDGFAATIEQLRKAGYKGCNVTVPFKFEAFQLATNRSKGAEAAEAVNTLQFNGDHIFGDNTDGVGLVSDIQVNLEIPLKNRRVLLMGAGGAAYGVAFPLVDIVGSDLTVVNRNIENAAKMIRAFKTRGTMVSLYRYEEESFIAREFDVVINATSTGLSDEMPPLPSGIFAPGALAYEMMYGRETPFMKFARAHGAAIVTDGLGMLVEQA